MYIIVSNEQWTNRVKDKFNKAEWWCQNLTHTQIPGYVTISKSLNCEEMGIVNQVQYINRLNGGQDHQPKLLTNYGWKTSMLLLE